jgi:hypothetical protein
MASDAAPNHSAQLFCPVVESWNAAQGAGNGWTGAVEGARGTAEIGKAQVGSRTTDNRLLTTDQGLRDEEEKNSSAESRKQKSEGGGSQAESNWTHPSACQIAASMRGSGSARNKAADWRKAKKARAIQTESTQHWWQASPKRSLKAECTMQRSRIKPPKATPKPVDSQGIATPKPPESECRMMNAECSTEALPAIYSGAQTAVQAKTRLNRAAAGRRDDSQARRLRYVRP